MSCIDGIGVLCDRPPGHLARKGGVAFSAAVAEPDGGARAKPVDRGADERVRQRHAFGCLDNAGDEAHVTIPFWGTIFKPVST